MFGSREYMDYCVKTAKLIADQKDYITELDAATGDGDHWANLNMGFEKITESYDELAVLPLKDLFKKIGMIMMSTIGGSSGVLYGSGYFSASKAIGDRNELDIEAVYDILAAMLDGICKRGNSGPGMKTMIDTLDAAVAGVRTALDNGVSDTEVLDALKIGAESGMEATRNMEAVRGRAYYQADKGVGHLDPGAVTMYYQLKTLAECMSDSI